ncbi:hypothetical protein WR25_18945 [Diploscapter pachys]|uniref:Uncharacterized protein n=1 Tax=Diploscapter pachys TaxID=2018661 RepID=A0A2A2K923_9BILA|nr:hypothetical protein WR25_18945 [Diploscapter pachys]
MEVDTAHSLQLSSRRLNLPRNSKHPEETEQIVKKREKGGMVCAKASCKKNFEDNVQERSLNPDDMTTPFGDPFFQQEIAVDFLEKQARCAKRIQHRKLHGHKLTLIGSMDPPVTLVMSLEKRTNAFLYEFLSDWCMTEDDDIKAILSHSTIVFLYGNERIQHNSCREYTSAQFVEPLLAKLHPYIGFNLVIMLATGGVKVRYFGPRNGWAESLAHTYRQNHLAMGITSSTELCGQPFSYKNKDMFKESELLIREMKWSTSFTSYSAALSHMHGLLLQVSCCYEELRVSYQYVENRRSLIEMFKERTTGIILEAPEAALITHNHGPILFVDKNTPSFIHLPFGNTILRVYSYSTKFLLTTFDVNLNYTHPFERRRISGI